MLEGTAGTLKWITPLHIAAYHGDADITEILLNHGADLNAAEGADYDVLDVALTKGHAQICRILLKYGATIDRKRDFCLFDSILSRRQDIIQLLVDNGADISWLSESQLKLLGPIPDEFLQMLKNPGSAK